MRPRRLLTILTLAALTAACGGASAEPSSGGDASLSEQPSEGATESQDGGGGGGTGQNGSITYQLTGDITQSGELAFFPEASSFDNGGWAATFADSSNPNELIQINSIPGSNIINYGDGEIQVGGTEEQGCTFNYSQNDASGLIGTIDCATTLSANLTTGATLNVSLHAEVNAHT